MQALSGLLRRMRYWVHRDAYARDLEEEMRIHVEMRAERLKQDGDDQAFAAGLSPMRDPAHESAQRRFGNTTIMIERSRDMWGLSSVEQLSSDLRFAGRRLNRERGFSLGVVAVMAIGIGAVTAMFSAVDAAMLRPLPFFEPDRLVAVEAFNIPLDADNDFRSPHASPPGFSELRTMKDVVSDVGSFASGSLNLSDPDNPLRVRVGVITPNMFGLLGVRPLVGRTFVEAEEVKDGPNVVILSYGLWRNSYGGRDIKGLGIPLGGRRYEVVGVMPPGFSFPGESDLWIPMSVPHTFKTFEPFRGFIPDIKVARLADGVSIEQARAQMLVRYEHWFSGLDSSGKEMRREGFADVRKDGFITPLQQSFVGEQSRPLYILLGATVLLLLVACVNVTNLMLSQAARRQREFALRGVLGATRSRLVRQMLAESVLLSLTGAVLGVALAPLSLNLLRVLMPRSLAGVSPADLDLRVLAFSAGVAVITGVGFGLLPALRSARQDASNALKSSSNGTTSAQSGRTRRVLVGAEVALTVVLLVGAGLMLRTFNQVMQQDSGLSFGNVGTMELTLPSGGASRAQRTNAMRAIIAALQSSPGVQAAGAVSDLPLNGQGGISVGVQTDGPPPAADKPRRYARILYATSGYFETVGIRLLSGRTFAATDDSVAGSVAVISQAMAKEYWPGMDPVGREINMGGDRPVRVIGVVSDVRERRLEDEAPPQMYMSLLASAPAGVAVVARGVMPSGVLLKRMTETVRATDRAQAVHNVRSFDEVLGVSVLKRRTNALLIGAFALLALILASVGVYAVVSNSVEQRARQLGIRSALGATGGHLVGLVSREVLGITVVGLALGVAGAWYLSRTLETLVFGISVHDAMTFALVPLLLTVPVAVATLIPARRATRVNPSEVMRAD
ncbi:MAG: ADOP family duplicated permease [Gemmatimonas sp.]